MNSVQAKRNICRIDLHVYLASVDICKLQIIKKIVIYFKCISPVFYPSLGNSTHTKI